MRSVREGVWRRHQCKENASLSGWSSNEDQKRRVIHYRDQYAIKGNHFVLDQSYLFFNIKNKKESIRLYNEKLHKGLCQGGWVETAHDKFQLEEMCCIIKVFDNTNYDLERNLISLNYQNLNLSIFSAIPNAEIVERPWRILGLGIRKIAPKGSPKYDSIRNIRKYLPAHVELGCGPSIEAGVLPLNYLHSIYSISHPDKSFIFEAKEDNVFGFLSNTETKYRETSRIHKTSLMAPVSQFYHDLKSLIDSGHLIAPIISNNFDGIPLSLDIEELYLREHDTKGIYPDITIHPSAKSLIVIGSHADRRGSQECARRAGLKIIFIDTEGYHAEDGFMPYPLESPQDEDIVIKMNAENALKELKNG